MTGDELDAKWSEFLSEYATVIGLRDDESFIPITPGSTRALWLAEEANRRFGFPTRIRVYGWRKA